ncbi:MAG: hypothetical protein H7146_08155 [Burkholderiaceae bacterium]|nr:hypothetical protein [Microbacteriaceae bacterium]
MNDPHIDPAGVGDNSSDLDDDRQRIAFLGDSITREGHWPEWFPEFETVNLAVDGSTTDDLLATLDHVVAARPDEIVMLIGTNDLGTRRSVEHLVRNIETMCVNLRRELPNSRMLMQSILPRGREFSQRIQEANIHLRQFSSTVRAQFLDLWPALALDDGELNPAFSDDRLHLNAAGYDAWLGELRPALVRLRELPPMTTPISIIRPDQFSRPTA